jgi:signal transduction histidine kinase
LRLRSWLPGARRTVRLRLTLLYGSLFLASGAALLTFTYELVSRVFLGNNVTGGPAVGQNPGGIERLPSSAVGVPVLQRATLLHGLVLGSVVALAAMALAAIWLGWLMAGRVLRPLRTMTAATRRISEANLHERLALTGPGDELKDLGDTIDGLLARLEGAFDAQRRFVANASHELRTPLTVERVMLETALADPDASAESLRATCEELLTAGRQQEQIIRALLTLARSQRGLEHREPFDLADVTAEVLSDRTGQARQRGVRVSASLAPAVSAGDPQLAQRLVANLADNALRHNVANGWMEVSTAMRGAHCVIRIANSGPVIQQREVERLFQPFQRGSRDRTARPDDAGLGLGLSIVKAIAAAHGAIVKGRAQSDGGLDIEVVFPAGHPASTGPSNRRRGLTRAGAGQNAGVS